MENPKFIVAEVSKNYVNGVALQNNGHLCQLFEKVIATNLQGDYTLHSWKMDRQVYEQDGDNHLNETIIAVFERRT